MQNFSHQGKCRSRKLPLVIRRQMAIEFRYC
jgi:hypothetical protein